MQNLKIVKKDGRTTIEADGHVINGVYSYELKDKSGEIAGITLEICVLGDIEVDIE